MPPDDARDLVSHLQILALYMPLVLCCTEESRQEVAMPCTTMASLDTSALNAVFPFT